MDAELSRRHRELQEAYDRLRKRLDHPLTQIETDEILREMHLLSDELAKLLHFKTTT